MRAPAGACGGPTYLRDRGYAWRDDHGRIEHTVFTEIGDHGFAERLRWRTPGGGALIVEDRRVLARLAPHGWELELATTLTNTAGRPLRLGSPATNGRDGAGYGGLFWRLPPAGAPLVRAGIAEGEQAVHGSVAPWLAWTDSSAGPAFTLVFAPADAATHADTWFVRVADYAGIGSQLAARTPVTLAPDASLTRGLRVLVADGALDDDAAAEWAAAAAADPAADATADRPADVAVTSASWRGARVVVSAPAP